MYCCTPTPTTDSNTSSGMIRVTLNVPSVANRHGNVREFHIVGRVVTVCLESGHHVSGEWSPCGQ